MGRNPDRPEKILQAMYELSGGTTLPLKYEDIVVKAFRLFPDEFALRGYPEYPDSSDIHKPLYGVLKKAGFVRSAQKTFALTARGIEAGARIVGKSSGRAEEARSPERITRDVKAELDRMLGSAAFSFYSEGRAEKILDTDFYAFLGCTVRTPRNDFLGRLSSTKNAVEVAQRLAYPEPLAAQQIAGVWDSLLERFASIIERRQGRN